MRDMNPLLPKLPRHALSFQKSRSAPPPLFLLLLQVRTCAIALIPNLPAANALKPFPPRRAAVAPVKIIVPRWPETASAAGVELRLRVGVINGFEEEGGAEESSREDRLHDLLAEDEGSYAISGEIKSDSASEPEPGSIYPLKRLTYWYQHYPESAPP